MTRKKVIIIIVTVLALLAVSFAGVYCWQSFVKKSFDFTNADSVSICDIDGGHLTELKDTDKAFAEKFCSAKNAVIDKFELPACFFDTVKITIVKNGKTYFIYPSSDECNNLKIDFNGKTYYGSMAESMDTFKELLDRNSIPWYWD
ncbi:MAG: hypothetical protein IJL87_09710 [Clostridia bacterium]|nr:hypothetical protein [Clostridia bacterium]